MTIYKLICKNKKTKNFVSNVSVFIYTVLLSAYHKPMNLLFIFVSLLLLSKYFNQNLNHLIVLVNKNTYVKNATRSNNEQNLSIKIQKNWIASYVQRSSDDNLRDDKEEEGQIINNKTSFVCLDLGDTTFKI